MDELCRRSADWPVGEGEEMSKLAPRQRAAWLLIVAMFLILTLLTQIGGVILLIVVLIARFAFPRQLSGWLRACAGGVLFIALYATISIFVIPPLANRAGRVPLPCRAGPNQPFAAANPM